MINDYCAGGLVFLQDKLVILKRFNGAWLFPKGHVDPGETEEIAALREVHEECGLTARIIQKLGVTSYTFTEQGMEHNKTVVWFLMEALSAEIRLEAGIFEDFKLLSESQINELTFPDDQSLALDSFLLYKKWKEFSK